MKEKLKVLFIPYILTTAGLILFLSLFNWICFIRFEIFNILINIWSVYFPLIISIFLIWFFFEERLRIYRFIFRWKKFNFIGLNYGILFFSIFLPGTLSQFYLYYATQERTVINSIDDIHKNKLTKFYNIKEFYIDKLKFGIHYFKNYDGGKLIMNFNYAFPVFGTPEDTVKTDPTAWLEFTFYKYLNFDSLKGTDIENREMQKFRKECDDKISAYNFRHFKRFERLDNSYLKLPLIKAVKKNNMLYEPNNLILIPEELQPNVYDADRVLFWFIMVWLTSSVIWFLWLF